MTFSIPAPILVGFAVWGAFLTVLIVALAITNPYADSDDY